MWLLIDIGNTAIKGLLYDSKSDTIYTESTLNSPSNLTVDTLKDILKEMLENILKNISKHSRSDTGLINLVNYNANLRKITRVGIASVVPKMTRVVNEAVKSLWNIKPTIVSSDLNLPFKIAYKTPETLGADRLSAAVAGYAQFGRHNPSKTVVIICAGTATTFEIISEGIYHGGIIAPGPRLMQQSLWSGTAQLPEVPLVLPATIIGTDTKSALQSGIMHGYLGLVEGILSQVAHEFPDPTIIVTGGWSLFLKDHLSDIDHQKDNFVLAGVLSLLKQNL